MKILYSLIFVLITNFSLQAQQISLGEMSRETKFNKLIEEVNNGKQKIKYSDIKGIPYDTPGFETARIGDTPTFVPIRYNSFLDTVEVLVNSGVYEIPREQSFQKFTFATTNKKLVFVNTGDEYAGYFYEISGGKNQILKKITTKFNDAVPAPNPMISGSPARFSKMKPIYFIKTETGLIKIPKNNKDLISSFPDRKDALNDFIKTNKIKLTEEADLIKLANFLNS